MQEEGRKNDGERDGDGVREGDQNDERNGVVTGEGALRECWTRGEWVVDGGGACARTGRTQVG